MWVLFLFNDVATWLGEWPLLCLHISLLPESVPGCCGASALAVAMAPAHWLVLPALLCSEPCSKAVLEDPPNHLSDCFELEIAI